MPILSRREEGAVGQRVAKNVRHGALVSQRRKHQSDCVASDCRLAQHRFRTVQGAVATAFVRRIRPAMNLLA